MHTTCVSPTCDEGVYVSLEDELKKKGEELRASTATPIETPAKDATDPDAGKPEGIGVKD